MIIGDLLRVRCINKNIQMYQLFSVLLSIMPSQSIKECDRCAAAEVAAVFELLDELVLFGFVVEGLVRACKVLVKGLDIFQAHRLHHIARKWGGHRSSRALEALH